MNARPPSPELRLEGPSADLLRAVDALRTVRDPRLGASVMELGLIELLRVSDGEVELRLVSTAGDCPLSDLMATQAMRALQRVLPEADFFLTHDQEVEWTPHRATLAARRRIRWMAAQR